ncbi:MAG: hypothetical protein ACLFWD_03790 [Anaerolineales bacterium]
MRVSSAGRPLPGILVGHHEPIFDALPGNVLDNFRRPGSENALLWNKLYPPSRSGLYLQELMNLPPIWGTPGLQMEDEALEAYFWGYRSEGDRLEGLDEALDLVDGAGPRTEVDLFLLGPGQLIAAEVKRGSSFGRCSRYNRQLCPAVHEPGLGSSSCRYWHDAAARFENQLTFEVPEPGRRPSCDRHYQLARTLLVGQHLAESLGRQFHLWVVTPRRRWRSLERTWLDFAHRVKDPETWRRMRVLAWEELEGLPVR